MSKAFKGKRMDLFLLGLSCSECVSHFLLLKDDFPRRIVLRPFWADWIHGKIRYSIVWNGKQSPQYILASWLSQIASSRLVNPSEYFTPPKTKSQPIKRPLIGENSILQLQHSFLTEKCSSSISMQATLKGWKRRACTTNYSLEHRDYTGDAVLWTFIYYLYLSNSMSKWVRNVPCLFSSSGFRQLSIQAFVMLEWNYPMPFSWVPCIFRD